MASRLRHLAAHLSSGSAAPAAAAGGGDAAIAVVGAGWWATGWHLPQLSRHPEAHIAAIVEMDESLRTELGELYGCPTFATLAELVASVDVQLDGVLISTPHRTHFELGMEAIDAGLNVLIEKPMTTTGPDAQVLVDAAKAGGKIFMVNTTANWREQTQRAVEVVASGTIGEVQHVQLHMGAPLMELFDDASRTTWTAPVGVAGLNGFAWGDHDRLKRLLSLARAALLTPMMMAQVSSRTLRRGCSR